MSKKTQSVEEKHQIAIIQWAQFQKLNTLKHACASGSVIGDYLFAIPNGGYRTKAEGGLLKAQGAKAGIPDLCLPIASSGFNALYIELKKPKVKGDKSPPKVSESQKRVMDLFSKANNLCVVCYGQDEAIKIIEMYLDHKLLGKGNV